MTSGAGVGEGENVGENVLGDRARPEGELAGRIEGLMKEEEGGRGGVDGVEVEVGEGKGEEIWGAENAVGQVPAELRDVVNTDWEGFTLDPELWQYV